MKKTKQENKNHEVTADWNALDQDFAKVPLLDNSWSKFWIDPGHWIFKILHLYVNKTVMVQGKTRHPCSMRSDQCRPFRAYTQTHTNIISIHTPTDI